MTDDREPDDRNQDRDALDDWGREWLPPPALREQTLRAVRERGLVGRPAMRHRTMLLIGAAAAALVMFLAGYGAGRRTADTRTGGAVNQVKPETDPAVPAVATQYALFLFENERYQPARDETAMRARVGEYSAWARSLAGTGRFVTGEKLSDDGRWCRLEGETMTVSAPVADGARGALAGYFVIGAASFEEAQSLAAGCPHLKYGGSVEIRKLETS